MRLRPDRRRATRRDRVRPRWRDALTAAAAVFALSAALAGCGPSSPQSSRHATTYARFTYTCCSAKLVSRSWHPGQTVPVRWSAVAGAPSSRPNAVPITLSARLTGPFKRVADLKSTMAASAPVTGVTRRRSLVAPAIHTTSLAGGAPVSLIVLPAQTPPGFYDLHTAVVAAGATSSGDAVVSVS